MCEFHELWGHVTDYARKGQKILARLCGSVLFILMMTDEPSVRLSDKYRGAKYSASSSGCGSSSCERVRVSPLVPTHPFLLPENHGTCLVGFGFTPV